MNEERPKVQAFKVNVSKGDPIPVDAEELPSIITAIKKGMPCRVKQGVFNPSYYVSITEDRQRIDEVEHYNSTAEENNVRIRHYGGVPMTYKGLQPLKDIFEGINLSTPNTLKKGDNPIPKIGQM